MGLAKADPTATDSSERGVQIGNPLAQTPGQVVQQGCRETPVDFATVELAVTDLAASRDLVVTAEASLYPRLSYETS